MYSSLKIIILTLLPFTVLSFDKIVLVGENITLTYINPEPPPELLKNRFYYSCDTGKTGYYDSESLANTIVLNTEKMLGQCTLYATVFSIANIESGPSNSVKILVKLNKPKTGGFR